MTGQGREEGEGRQERVDASVPRPSHRGPVWQCRRENSVISRRFARGGLRDAGFRSRRTMCPDHQGISCLSVEFWLGPRWHMQLYIKERCGAKGTCMYCARPRRQVIISPREEA